MTLKKKYTLTKTIKDYTYNSTYQQELFDVEKSNKKMYLKVPCGKYIEVTKNDLEEIIQLLVELVCFE